MRAKKLEFGRGNIMTKAGWNDVNYPPPKGGGLQASTNKT